MPRQRNKQIQNVADSSSHHSTLPAQATLPSSPLKEIPAGWNESHRGKLARLIAEGYEIVKEEVVEEEE